MLIKVHQSRRCWCTYIWPSCQAILVKCVHVCTRLSLSFSLVLRLRVNACTSKKSEKGKMFLGCGKFKGIQVNRQRCERLKCSSSLKSTFAMCVSEPVDVSMCANLVMGVLRNRCGTGDLVFTRFTLTVTTTVSFAKHSPLAHVGGWEKS